MWFGWVFAYALSTPESKVRSLELTLSIVYLLKLKNPSITKRLLIRNWRPRPRRLGSLPSQLVIRFTRLLADPSDPGSHWEIAGRSSVPSKQVCNRTNEQSVRMSECCHASTLFDCKFEQTYTQSLSRHSTACITHVNKLTHLQSLSTISIHTYYLQTNVRG